MITIKDLFKALTALGILYLMLGSFMFADYRAIDGNTYKGYWSSGKYFITEQDKPIKVISFSKQVLTGENCNTSSVVSPVCNINQDVIKNIIITLELYIKYACVPKDVINQIRIDLDKINEESVVSSNETKCTPTNKVVEIQTISDIIYIKGKTKYINTFRLAPTGAL